MLHELAAGVRGEGGGAGVYVVGWQQTEQSIWQTALLALALQDSTCLGF